MENVSNNGHFLMERIYLEKSNISYKNKPDIKLYPQEMLY